MSTDMQTDKPEPIRVGTKGFNAFEAKSEPLSPIIDWQHIAGLPPFEMFMAERHSTGDQSPSQALFDEYCQWHKNKGYWPNEDPMGRLKNA